MTGVQTCALPISNGPIQIERFTELQTPSHLFSSAPHTVTLNTSSRSAGQIILYYHLLHTEWLLMISERLCRVLVPLSGSPSCSFFSFSFFVFSGSSSCSGVFPFGGCFNRHSDVRASGECRRTERLQWAGRVRLRLRTCVESVSGLHVQQHFHRTRFHTERLKTGSVSFSWHG